MHLTLIPNGLAKTGHQFQHYGDQNADECEGCPVRQLCFKIEPGHYEVNEIRDVEHPCHLHEGTMRVCTVEPVPVTSTILSKSLKGTAAEWAPIPCEYPECTNNALCHPRIASGKMEILEEGKAVTCPMNYDIKQVTMKPIH